MTILNIICQMTLSHPQLNRQHGMAMWHRLMYLAIPCYLVIHQHLNTLS